MHLRLTAAGALAAFFLPFAPVPAPAEEVNRPVAVEDRGYVAAERCRRCHEDQFASWHHSYHRTMTQVVSPDTVLGDFSEQKLNYLNHEALIYRKGDRFWAHLIDPDWENKDYYEVEEKDAEGKVIPRSKTPPWVDREIVMSTGSHHMQEYWLNTGFGGTLAQLPFVWLEETSQWVHRDSIFMEPPKDHAKPSEMGRWNYSCANCHSTAPQPGVDVNSIEYWEDLRETDTRVADFGISCQACHGPGEAHVHHQEELERLEKAGSPSPAGDDDPLHIVNPRDLEPRLGSHVCAQCHGIRIEFDRDQVLREYAQGREYRPGDDIEKFQHFMRYTAEPKGTPMEAIEAADPGYLETVFWRDGAVRVTGREFNGLVESACFNHGDAGGREVMTCFSCHDLHQTRHDLREPKHWANDQLHPNALGDQSCLQCHEYYSSESAQAAHTHHPPGSAGSACYNCHMPHTSYGLLKAIRIDTVDSPSTATPRRSGRPTACNLCHLDKTLAWTAGHLEDWYGIARPESIDRDREPIADSILWILQGDAGLRALAAWHMGWEPALDISGRDWVIPYLGEALADDYHAVRYIAARSLRKHDAFKVLAYDFEDPPEKRRAVADEVTNRFHEMEKSPSLAGRGELLLDGETRLLTPAIRRLLGLQDKREVWLNE